MTNRDIKNFLQNKVNKNFFNPEYEVNTDKTLDGKHCLRFFLQKEMTDFICKKEIQDFKINKEHYEEMGNNLNIINIVWYKEKEGVDIIQFFCPCEY